LGWHSEGQQKGPRLSAQTLALKTKGKVQPTVSRDIRKPQRAGGTPAAAEIASEGWHNKGKNHQFLPCLENKGCQKWDEILPLLSS